MELVRDLWRDEISYTFSSKNIRGNDGKDTVRISYDSKRNLFYDICVGNEDLSTFISVVRNDSENGTDLSSMFVLRIKSSRIKDHIARGSFPVGQDPECIIARGSLKTESLNTPGIGISDFNYVSEVGNKSHGTVYIDKSNVTDDKYIKTRTSESDKNKMAGNTGLVTGNSTILQTPGGGVIGGSVRGAYIGAENGVVTILNQEKKVGSLMETHLLTHYLIDLAKSVLFIPMEHVPNIVGVLAKASFIGSVSNAASQLLKNSRSL